MPVPETQANPNASGVSFDTPNAVGGLSFDDQRLRLPGPRGPWTWCISPAGLECRNGRILPHPAKAWFDDGYSNNFAGGNGNGLKDDLARLGYTVTIPHTTPVIAFGEQVVGTADCPSTYLRRHVGIDMSRSGESRAFTCVRFTDAWTRYNSLGHLTVKDEDSDGRDDWLESLIPLFAPNGLSKTQIEIATYPVIRKCQRLLDRSDQRGIRTLYTAVLHLPAEHVPPDLTQAYDDALKARERRVRPVATPEKTGKK